jgi:hypothetical protein
MKEVPFRFVAATLKDPIQAGENSRCGFRNQALIAQKATQKYMPSTEAPSQRGIFSQNQINTKTGSEAMRTRPMNFSLMGRWFR